MVVGEEVGVLGKKGEGRDGEGSKGFDIIMGKGPKDKGK